MINRVAHLTRRRFVENGFDLEAMTKIEKEALCYRLLKGRDAINDKLRLVQQSIQDEITEE